MIAGDEILQAILSAPPDRRRDALRVLRGEVTVVEAHNAPSEQYLGLGALAEVLNVSPCTLWRWRIPGHAFGGRPRYRLSEVRAYLEGEDFKRRLAVLRAERRLAADGRRRS
jgi:hypothetical protein